MICPTTQTILIVEDDVRMRQMIRSVVQDLAAELIERDDGADAVAAYDQYMPDWVLMDIKLRNVDGLTATKRIVARHPQARVIIVTNYDSPGFKDEARFAGACGYVLKNHLVELRHIIQTHLDNSAGSGL
jgi:two-component system response regulator DegU